jgi:transcription antitermination factor NusG
VFALGSLAPRPNSQDKYRSACRASDDKPRRSVREKRADSVVGMFPFDVLSADRAADSCADSGEDFWWLAHTRPRQEKALVVELLARKVGFYLPLVTRKSLTRGRTRIASLPLFPGYVFVNGNEEARLSALRTNRLVMLRRVSDGELLRSQLLKFAELIAAGIPLVREARLVAGERVRIKAGRLRDTEGVVLRRNGKTELIIAIDFLQQGAALEIDDCLLEPV